MLTPLRVLLLGLLFVGMYLTWVWGGLAPTSVPLRLALADLAVVVPTGAALWGSGRAYRQARGPERAFWALLAGAATAQLVNCGVFLLHTAVLPGMPALRVIGQAGYYSYVVLVFVALLVRPDRPRGTGSDRPATLEWLMAVGSLYFMLFYFLLLPAAGRPFHWFVLFTVQDLIPAAWAFTLAWRVGPSPFRRVYALIAAGFAAGAASGVLGNVNYARGSYEDLAPHFVMWMFPMVGIVAASLCERRPVWVRGAALERRSDRRRARLAVAAVALPPLVDLVMRAAGVAPHLAEARTDITLVATPMLAVLAALRLRLVAAPPAALATADSPEARAALGVPSESLQFASGVAHELNNPLMAVVGWAELALRRNGPTPAVRELMESAHRAADVVQRLQQIAQVEDKVTPPPGGDR